MSEFHRAEDDGLYIPKVKVGEWSREKHYFLRRYIDAFTTAMKDKWGGLHYIDLFAGAGIERLRDSGELDWGSPMIAAQVQFPFHGLHFCEKNKRKYEALSERLKRAGVQAQVLHGDANDEIGAIVESIPSRTLSLAFLDPYGLHLEYATLQVLSNLRADLIIFFPDYLDVLRNWERNYLRNQDSNLDRCLGPGANWRGLLETVPQDQYAQRLRELCVRQLRERLGYTQFEYRRISFKNHPLYVLIFCSRNEIGAKLWRGVSQKERDGQRNLPF